MSDPNELREDLKLYAAATAVRNQERQLDEQRKLVAKAAEVEANSAKRAVLSKLTDLLIDGAASDYNDEAFLKKLRVFLGSSQTLDLAEVVLDELKQYPTVLDFAYEVFVAQGGIKISWSAPDGSSGEAPIEMWATERYRFGIDGVTQDLGRALRFARIGAERKVADCMAYVGEALAHGLACDRNVNEAVSALEQAARWGSSEAFVSLARLHKAQSNTAGMVETLRAGHARCPDDPKLALMLAQADAVWTGKHTEERHQLYMKAARGGQIDVDSCFLESIDTHIVKKKRLLTIAQIDDVLKVLAILQAQSTHGFELNERLQLIVVDLTETRRRYGKRNSKIVALVSTVAFGGFLVAMYLKLSQ